MNRCRAGDLAIIVHSRFPENLGALVHVDRAFFTTESGETIWDCSSLGSGLLAMRWDGDIVARSPIGCCADSQLRPLRGEPERDVDEIRELAPQQLEGVACWP